MRHVPLLSFSEQTDFVKNEQIMLIFLVCTEIFLNETYKYTDIHTPSRLS